MGNDHRQVTIRLASQDDAQQIAHLCELLGYPVSVQHLKPRLANLLPHSDHALFVAERPGEPLPGWVHVYRCLLIHTDPEAQIGELVVDAAVRRSGAGHRLMQAAEQWARAGLLGCLFTLECHPQRCSPVLSQDGVRDSHFTGVPGAFVKDEPNTDW